MSAANKLVPELRFPEFEEDGEWHPCDLDSAAQIPNKKVSVKKISLADYVSTENILPDFGGLGCASNLPNVKSVTQFLTEDTLFANIRPYLRKAWFANRAGGASNDVIVFRSRENVSPQFLSLRIRSDAFVDYVMSGAKGLKMPRGDVSQMKTFPFPLPPTKAEQQKIADCLGSLDDLIAAHNRRLAALQEHKKGLLQQLFPAEGETTPKLRFPEFEGAGQWQPLILRDFIRERKEPAKADIPLYSLTIEDGVTPKSKRYERAFLVSNEKEAYKIVKKHDFAYNPMNLRFGAIARYSGDKPVAVSKYYDIFYCEKDVSSSFCNFYFRSKVMVALYDKMAEGSLIEKRRVHFSDFLNFKILFPSLPEQQKIADCLSDLDALITVQTDQITALKAHKKGLMQKLFPSG